MIKEDALLGTFLAEPSFEQWRKHSSISLEEESASKRIDRVEEMTIPSDLEDKLGYIFSSSCKRETFTRLNFSQACPTQDRPSHRSLAENLHIGRTPRQKARGCSGTKHQHSAVSDASFASAICPSHVLLPLKRLGHHVDATDRTRLSFPPPGSYPVPFATFDRTGRPLAPDEHAQDAGGSQRAMLEGR